MGKVGAVVLLLALLACKKEENKAYGFCKQLEEDGVVTGCRKAAVSTANELSRAKADHVEVIAYLDMDSYKDMMVRLRIVKEEEGKNAAHINWVGYPQEHMIIITGAPEIYSAIAAR